MGDTGLQIRQPGEEGDYLVLRWWAQLRESGELLDIFSNQAATPGGFLNIFNNPNTTLFYREDENGLCVAIWFESFMENMSLGLWARPDYRHRRFWDDLVTVHRAVLQHVPLIICVTKRLHVVKLGVDFGYHLSLEIPYVYRGENGYVGYITREDFEKKHG